MRDSSAFSVCILFEESVFIFQFLNEQLCQTKHNCEFHNSKIEKSRRENLAFSVCILFEENVFIFQFLNDEIHSYVLFDIMVRSKIEK